MLLFVEQGIIIQQCNPQIHSQNAVKIAMNIHPFCVNIFHRRKRMAEMMDKQNRAKFGTVQEITKSDWVREVNEAGEGVWVVIHVYKQG